MPFADPDKARLWRQQYDRERSLGLRRRESPAETARAMAERVEADRERNRQWCQANHERRLAQQRERRRKDRQQQQQTALEQLTRLLSPDTPDGPPVDPAMQSPPQSPINPIHPTL